MGANAALQSPTQAETNSILWTQFLDHSSSRKSEIAQSWAELVSHLGAAGPFDSKDACPWIKLATFGDARTKKGALRNDANVIKITGIEGDYDAEVITPEAAIEVLERAGIRACVYTSPSSRPDAPRWRVLAPLFAPTLPSSRSALVARLNGVLGGILASESFTVSQSYFYGRTAAAADYRVLVTFDDPDDGTQIDLLDELDEIAIGSSPAASSEAAPKRDRDQALAGEDLNDEQRRDLNSALFSMSADDRTLWVENGLRLKGLGEAGRILWFSWSATSSKFDSSADLNTWESFTPTKTGWRAVLSEAQRRGWQNPAKGIAPKMGPTIDQPADSGRSLDDFFAYLPAHLYINVHTRDQWPAASVDGCISEWPKLASGKNIRPSRYLDEHRAVDQICWAPGLPLIIDDRIVDAGGWVAKQGARVFNRYRPPNEPATRDSDAGLWIDHVRLVYPGEAEHIFRWLAQRHQHPEQKINHALVIGGAQGVGKDTLLEPSKHGVGHWNFSEINPAQMLGTFNAWAQSVILRVNEARDLGDIDRFALYDHSKTFIAAPPDVIRINEKHTKEWAAFNVCGVIITTNHRTDGLYLPPDDRRHFVAWAEVDRNAFDESYWLRLWKWYEQGGIDRVCNWLRAYDLASFDPKAPPPRTEAWQSIVRSSVATEDYELADAIERAGNCQAVTLEILLANAQAANLQDLCELLRDRRQRRSLPHRLDRAGYVPVRNPNAEDGLWRRDGRRQVVYAAKALTVADQFRAARELCDA